MKQKQIQQLFQQRYNQQRWKEFLAQTFTNARLYSTPDILLDINTDVATQALQLGNIKLNENGIERNIAVYDVTLASGIVLERNRVGLRNLLRKFWKDIDGAFIVFHRDGVPSWRFTYVSELKGFDAEGEWIEIKTEPKRFTYVLGELESCRTASERFALVAEKGSDTTLDDIKEAFSVEKLSISFFDEYKRQYELFCDYMINQPSIFRPIFESEDKSVRDFTKKMLGRIVFLFFIQKKGWMGVPENEDWGKGDLNYLGNLFNNCSHPELFYSEYLCKLFFSTLNTQRPNDIAEIVTGDKIRIPFLNGGLFEEDNPKHRNLIFPKKLFSDLFDFFNQYNFTIYEDDPNDQTVAVDPEMLGHIFENLLEDNKDKGTFYTPKEIVHYMCQESLIEYLTTHFEGKGYEVTSYSSFDKPDQPELFPINHGRTGPLKFEPFANDSKKIDRVLIEKLLKQKLEDADKYLILKHADEFNKALDKVKICDPAIGSGAFPMGLLKEIFNAKQTIHTFKNGSTKYFDASSVKLNIIQNSIYGVDIEKGAVDIARLRFWLSLVVDEETPKALPNLDYKIVVGDSLVSKLGDDIIDIDWSINKEDNNLFGSDLVHKKLELLKEISVEQKEFFNPHSDKKSQAVNIRNLKIDLLINQLGLMVKTANQEIKPSRVNFGNNKKYVEATELYLQSEGWKKQINKLQTLKAQPNKPLKFFDWKLDFPEVMNEQVAVNVGFDIILGNPPYVSAVTMARDDETKEYFKQKFPLATGAYDLYLLFVLKAINLSNNNGIYTWIIPNKFLIADYAKQTRLDLIKTYGLSYSINVSKFNVFEGVGVYPIIIFGNKSTSNVFQEYLLEAYEDLEQRKFNSPTLLRNHKTFKEFDLKINAGATGFQAKQLKKIISNSKRKGSFPFIVSGSVDKYKWTNESVRYMGERYTPAFIHDSPKTVSDSKWEFWSKPKIVIAGMTKVIEAVYVDVPLGMGVGIYGIYDFKGFDPYCLTAILNSKYLTYYFQIKFKDKHLAGGYLAINKSTIEAFPLVDISKTIQIRLSDLSTKAHELSKQEKSINNLEKQIDKIVYKLYGLTYDEIKIIDPEFGLSKEEYDNLEIE